MVRLETFASHVLSSSEIDNTAVLNLCEFITILGLTLLDPKRRRVYLVVA
jgi:hypothetical protein